MEGDDCGCVTVRRHQTRKTSRINGVMPCLNHGAMEKRRLEKRKLVKGRRNIGCWFWILGLKNKIKCFSLLQVVWPNRNIESFKPSGLPSNIFSLVGF
jgi:hypothetical protein